MAADEKLTEHPAVDYWVKLMRESDAASTGKNPAEHPRRIATDAREWDRYCVMQRARTRRSYSVGIDLRGGAAQVSEQHGEEWGHAQESE